MHHGDVTWASWRPKSPITQLVVKELVRANIKENIKVSHLWPVDSHHRRPVKQKVFPCQNWTWTWRRGQNITISCFTSIEKASVLVLKEWFLIGSVNITAPSIGLPHRILFRVRKGYKLAHLSHWFDLKYSNHMNEWHPYRFRHGILV